MKSKAAILWFLVSVALGFALVVQWNSARRQKLKMEQLQMQVEQGTAKGKDSAARVQELEKEVRTLTAELRTTEFQLNKARAPQLASQQPGASKAQTPAPMAGQRQGDSAGGGMGKMLANMMKDPEMRKAMEGQQRMGLEMMYGSLFKELQLPPEQEKKLRDMLLAQQMENMSQAGAMFDGEGADRGKLAQELAEKNKKNQDAIKELLGDDKYAAYQEYNQTIGERMMLDQLGKQVELSPEQNQQLLGIIREEKKNVQINRGQPQFDPNQDWQKVLGSGEAAEKLFSQQEEVNNRVLERAGQVLTPDQLQKFEPLLKTQLEMQKAGMRMAREMFKTGDQGQAPPTSAPVERQ
jgi:hypothetical protein